MVWPLEPNAEERSTWVKNVCDICEREFITLNGLGLHILRVHTKIADTGINIERLKARWSEKVIRIMAMAEDISKFCSLIVQLKFKSRNYDGSRPTATSLPNSQGRFRQTCERIRSRSVQQARLSIWSMNSS